jgi:hypothetical protein
MFINKQKGNSNKDLKDKNLQYYLDIAGDFKSSFPDFKVIKLYGKYVIDESQSCEVGYKARAGELLIQKLKSKGVKEIVYVQPRQGFAGISLSYLCRKYEMGLTLIMPSSKEASPHQLLCIELGAKPLFLRVAAMANANVMAKKYADSTNAAFIPLGLYHEDVVACGVKLIRDFFKDKEKPKEIWSVISTGVLTRTLQIALPDAYFFAVAVSRNIQDGELGKASFMSYHKPFNAYADLKQDILNTESKYDAKGYEYFENFASEGAYFFNVAGNAPLPIMAHEEVDSYRAWNDLRDFKFLNKH